MMSYRVESDLFLAVPRPKKDAAELFRLIENDRGSMRKFLPWVDSLKKIGDEENFLAQVNINYAKEDSLNLVIWYRQKIVGMISFNSFDKLNNVADIGYWLGQKYRGHGIMTKAVKGICAIGFNDYDLHRIIIRAATDNEASNAVANRAGFIHEGILRKNEKLHDGYHDENIFSLLRDEWNAMSDKD